MKELDNPVVERPKRWKENIAVKRIDSHARNVVKMTVGPGIQTGIKAIETQRLQDQRSFSPLPAGRELTSRLIPFR